jgi:transcriptional regulator with XRE-family HTH domain
MITPNNFFNPRYKILYRLSEYVKNYRSKNNLTQKELADACGFDQAYIQMIETRSGDFSLDIFAQLAKGMGIGTEDLLGRVI